MQKLALVLLFVTCATVFCTSLFDGARVQGSIDRLYTSTDKFLASVFFVDSVTELSLKRAYVEATTTRSNHRRAEKVKVLIVPGHDPEHYGTIFNGLKEVELTVDLGQRIYDLLKKEPGFQVYLSQTKDGYNPLFDAYFENNREEIQAFVDKQKAEMAKRVNAGDIDRVVNVEHNYAPGEMGLRLFGFNKWANENGIDIVIHVHFNDYPTRSRTSAGKYSGFTIYVPESQYSNAAGSKSVALALKKRLSEFYPISNFLAEREGIVEDQELIAIGSDNSLDAASALIEYGYIYEPQFVDPELRNVVLDDLAYQTYLGVVDFFGIDSKLANNFDTELLPHAWNADLEKGDEDNSDVLRLQAALLLNGVYPPAGKTQNDCGLTGQFGPCTQQAVKTFQEKNEIAPVTGFVGEKTRTKLNELFGK